MTRDWFGRWLRHGSFPSERSPADGKIIGGVAALIGLGVGSGLGALVGHARTITAVSIGVVSAIALAGTTWMAYYRRRHAREHRSRRSN